MQPGEVPVSAAAQRAAQTPQILVLRALVAFALIFGTGAIAFALPNMGAHLRLPLLPSGIAIAALYRWGRRLWPAVFVAGVAIDLSAHNALLAALGTGVGLAGGAALAAWVLERRGFDPSFSRARDVPLFILATAIGMTLAPTFGMLGLHFSGTVIHASDAIRWLRWWMNTTAGALLTAPILVAASRRSLAQITHHWRTGAVWMLGIALCCAATLYEYSGPITRAPIVVFAVVLIVVGAFYFGLVVAASGAFVILATTAYSIAFDYGAFNDLDGLDGLVMIWSLSSLLTGLTLIITALLAERDSEGAQRLRAEQQYAQIFDGSPQPIWVHDQESLRILMINEAAVRQYGWSRTEILSMTAAELMAPGESLSPPDAEGDPAAARAEPAETRHATRDGRVLDVEVWTRALDFLGRPAELVFAVDVTERRAFGRALVDAIAGEQRRIGQEMHDGLGQELTGLALSVRALANRAERERDAIAEDLDGLALLATSCIESARLIVQGLSPLTDADGSLETALEALARRSSLSGTQVRFRAPHGTPLGIDLKVRNHLYRIAQEAVQNALKHSGATTVDIDLSVRDAKVRLEILDNGRGLPAQDARGIGLGMRTMRFRCSAIGGRLLISHRDGAGNSVVCEAPQSRAWPEPEREAKRPPRSFA
jgi:PAS domain S-box-containing protein